ncbi:uncharacterized protein RBU33_019558 [Hipposideros larvatus]
MIPRGARNELAIQLTSTLAETKECPAAVGSTKGWARRECGEPDVEPMHQYGLHLLTSYKRTKLAHLIHPPVRKGFFEEYEAPHPPEGSGLGKSELLRRVNLNRLQ